LEDIGGTGGYRRYSFIHGFVSFPSSFIIFFEFYGSVIVGIKVLFLVPKHHYLRSMLVFWGHLGPVFLEASDISNKCSKGTFDAPNGHGRVSLWML